MNWVNKCKLTATKAIKYENNLCITTKRLWEALHTTFNLALHHQINKEVLSKIESKPISTWVPFSKEEFQQALIKCNNSSALGPDKLT